MSHLALCQTFDYQVLQVKVNGLFKRILPCLPPSIFLSDILFPPDLPLQLEFSSVLANYLLCDAGLGMFHWRLLSPTMGERYVRWMILKPLLLFPAFEHSVLGGDDLANPVSLQSWRWNRTHWEFTADGQEKRWALTTLSSYQKTQDSSPSTTCYWQSPAGMI